MYRISFKNIGIKQKSFVIICKEITCQIFKDTLSPYFSGVNINITAKEEGEYHIGWCGFDLGEYKIERLNI